MKRGGFCPFFSRGVSVGLRHQVYTLAWQFLVQGWLWPCLCLISLHCCSADFFFLLLCCRQLQFGCYEYCIRSFLFGNFWGMCSVRSCGAAYIRHRCIFYVVFLVRLVQGARIIYMPFKIIYCKSEIPITKELSGNIFFCYTFR